MKNKVLVELYLPLIDQKHDVLVPISKSIASITVLLTKAINELSENVYEKLDETSLYDVYGKMYEDHLIIKDTDIKNGSKIIMF